MKQFFKKIGILHFVLHLQNKVLQFTDSYKWKTLKKHDKIWLELGSGAKKGSGGWTTVDLAGADISFDLRSGIPLPGNSVDRIYTSHMLEHIPHKQMQLFINECYRVLKKEGELSVSVPNARLYIESYINGSRFKPIGVGYQPALIETGSLLDQVNYIAYMDGHHHYMFDEVNLINTLKHAPFSSVRLRKFDELLDLKSRDYESIYAIAIK